MKLVADAVIRPQHCALLPYVGSSREPIGFFDNSTYLNNERVYVSFTAFKEIASLAGYAPHPPQGAALADQARIRYETRIGLLDAEIASLREQLAAVKTLKAAGFVASRGPGRPPKHERTAA